MKILQINAIYGYKSTGSIVRDLDDHLREQGHVSYIVCQKTNVHRENVIELSDRTDRLIHALRTRADGKQGYSSMKQTEQLIKKLELLEPDLIHLHNVHSNFLNFEEVFGFARKKHIPVVLTLHDCWFFTGKCYHFSDIGCEKWKTGCGHCPKRYKDIPSIFRDSSAEVFADRLRLFDYDRFYVAGCSRWITKKAQQSPLFQKAGLECITNGIDLECFKDTEERENGGTFGSFGTFTAMAMAEKWFHPANRQMREDILTALGPKDRLVLAGCSKKQIKECSRQEKILPLGYIKEPESLAKLYSGADVFINLTRADTLPTVNMEAAACGTPVITWDAGGSGELVSQGETGFAVETDDRDGMLEALEKIRNKEIGRAACRVYAEQHFDRKLCLMKYLELYQRAVLNER